MSLAPANLLTVAKYWTTHKGVNLGIVGDAAHTAGGTSYHLGRDHLLPGAYSARTARDRAGLSVYASAIDLGMLNGTFSELRAFSKWLVDQCRHGARDTLDIREVIYSPDGQTVLRWDRENGIASQPHDGEADMTHRTHTHVSWYRDSRSRSQVGPFRRYIEGPAPTHTIHIAAGATFVVVTLSGACIAKVGGEYGVPHTWSGPNSKAPCGPKIPRKTCDGKSSATTVLVSSSPNVSAVIRGRHIRIDPPGVTVS